MYQIRHSTKRGGSGIITVPTNERLQAELLKLYKQRLKATAEKDGVVIGEVCKHDDCIFDNPRQKWTWYLDTEA